MRFVHKALIFSIKLSDEFSPGVGSHKIRLNCRFNYLPFFLGICGSKYSCGERPFPHVVKTKKLRSNGLINRIYIGLFVNLGDPGKWFSEGYATVDEDPSLLLQYSQNYKLLGILLVLTRKIENFRSSPSNIDVVINLLPELCL
jgi:hypothetical protein